MSDEDLYFYAGLAVALVGLVAYLRGQSSAQYEGFNAAQDLPPSEDEDQLPSLVDSAIVAVTPSTWIDSAMSQDQAAQNLRAFLDMIAYAEGTSGPDGYRTMFGHRLFTSFADHPRQYFDFTDGAGRQLKTSAAGRYQFLARTWDALKAKLSLPDFGPESQDAAALELVRQRGALNDVKAGRLSDAIAKCAPIWASLPGAGYSQPERKLSTLAQVFTDKGGNLDAA
jgi:lysozyme